MESVYKIILGIIIGLAIIFVIGWIVSGGVDNVWKIFKSNAETKETCMLKEGKYPVLNAEDGTFKRCNDCPSKCDKFDKIACTKGFCGLRCKLINDKCVAG